jgi:S1-C subfamily serine protease
MKKNLISLFAVFIYSSLACADIQPDALFARESSSIVLIAASNGKESSLGTGFVVASDGIIVTNYHIIRKAKEIAVKLSNGLTIGELVVAAVDASKDLALLKINKSDLDPVTLGDSRDIRVGQKVMTIGNPYGLESTISDGLISSLRKTESGLEVIQISVPLSEGSSGGPLYNMDGEVIGVTTATFQKGQNLNFAVPINYLKPLISKASGAVVPKQGRARKIYIIRKPHAPELSQENAAPRHKTYMVKAGDTLYSISRAFLVPVNELIRVNALRSNKIYKGQRLKIPS